jgi:hypothetical protein
VILALGYFIAELWHGPSRRTWHYARIAAAVALMGPVILWLLRLPLCAIAGVESVNAGSQACNGNPGNLVVTPAALGMVVVGLVTLVLLVRQLVVLARPRADGRQLQFTDLVPLLLIAIAGGVLLSLTRLLPGEDPLFSVPGIIPELFALLVGVPLALLATQVLTARDARRFVVGLVLVAGFWLGFLYPNIAALPLPSAIVNAYQGILPTYIYAFQFGVNTVERGGSISFADWKFALLVAFLVGACAVVAWSARVWRTAPAADRAEPGGAPSGPAGETGTA